jgi:hypothetical protein
VYVSDGDFYHVAPATQSPILAVTGAERLRVPAESEAIPLRIGNAGSPRSISVRLKSLDRALYM